MEMEMEPENKELPQAAAKPRRTSKKKAAAAPPLILPPAPHIEECSPEWQQFYAAVRDAVKKLG